MGYCVVSFF